MADVGNRSRASSEALPAALREIIKKPKFPETEVSAKYENITHKVTKHDREGYHLCMQNNGSRYLNPSKGPREHPVTNLKEKTPKEKRRTIFNYCPSQNLLNPTVTNAATFPYRVPIYGRKMF